MKYLNDTQTTRLWAKIKDRFVSKSGDTMTGALTLAGDPVSDLQAATKKYVDDNAGSGGGTAKIWTGYCNTRADVVPKVVVLDDPTGFSLDADTRIAVRFYWGIEVPSGSITINVNDTGEAKIYVPVGTNLYSSSDNGKMICSTGSTCFFSFHEALGSGGGWVLETSGLLLSKAYDIAHAALPKAGGTMTGALTLSGVPTSDLHAATKKYVDDSIPEVPTKVSDLTNDAGFITSYTETDPTVPSWAKQSSKPTYTASEVGALPSSTVIPTKTSDLTNDSGFITGYTETDPTVPSWAKASSKPSYTASEVGAVPTSRTVNGKALSENISLSASDVGALPSSTTIPTASTANPSMDGTASYGSGTSYARSNHVHPTDTSRQAKITASGLLKGDGSGGVSAASAGTDYAAASHSHGNITSTGNISGVAPTIVSGDRVVILDASVPTISNGPTFDGSTTTKALTPKGTWETFLTLDTLPIYDGTVV